MKRLFNTSSIVTLAVILSACTTPAPTYRNINPSPTDAEISFESDFDLHTHFSLNTTREAACGKFESVGYLLKADSIFIYDKPNKEIKVKVPTGKQIGVAGYHYFSDPSYRASCYPQGQFFTPMPFGKYVVRMNKTTLSNDRSNRETAFCFISILEVEANGAHHIVKPENPSACKN